MTATQIPTHHLPAYQRIAVGAAVTAQNPGGRTVEGTLVGWTEEGFALVEWFGPWMYEQRRRYVGRFTQIAEVTA